MVNLATVVVLATSLIALASPLSKRTVAQVEADLTTINNDVVSLVVL